MANKTMKRKIESIIKDNVNSHLEEQGYKNPVVSVTKLKDNSYYFSFEKKIAVKVSYYGSKLLRENGIDSNYNDSGFIIDAVANYLGANETHTVDVRDVAFE